MLGVVVVGEDGPGGGVDLVVVLLVVGGVELHVVHQPAVVPVQLRADEGHLVGAQPRVVQGDLPGPLGGEGAGLGTGLVEAVGVGDLAAAGEDDGVGVSVPVHVLAHQAADGPDGQVDGPAVGHGIDRVAVHVGEGALHPVHQDGVLRMELHGHGAGRGAVIGGAPGGGGGAGAGEGDGVGGLVPVHVLAHELADGADGQVGGAVVGDGVDLLALDIVEGAGRAVHQDGVLRMEAGGDGAALGGAGGHGQGPGGEGGAEHQRAHSSGNSVGLHDSFLLSSDSVGSPPGGRGRCVVLWSRLSPRGAPPPTPGWRRCSRRW